MTLDNIANQKSYHLDLILMDISNPFILFIIFILPILYAFVYFIFGIYSTTHIVTDEIQSDQKSAQQIIEEEIQNRYLGKIDEIHSKISARVHKSTEPSHHIEKVLWGFCNELGFSQGLLYRRMLGTEPPCFELNAAYAYIGDTEAIRKFEVGIGINGQVAASGEPVFLKDIPKDYIKVISGLGESHPDLLLIIPIIDENQVVTVLLEVAGFGSLNTEEIKTVYEISQTIFSKTLIN